MTGKQTGMTTRPKPSERQRDEAAMWVARLSDPDATAKDRAAFTHWLDQDPLHRQAYTELAVLYDTLAPAAQAADRRAGWTSRALAHLQPGPRWGLVASAVAASALLVWIDNPSFLQDMTADIRTGRQPVTAATLPDGSTVRMAAGTALKLDFSGGTRHVRLLHGEALFAVRHDAAHPFSVTTGGYAIRDVGTEFDIADRATESRVFVAQGAVDILANGTPVAPTLHAGDEAILPRHKPATVAQGTPDIALAWLSGRLVVQDTTMTDLAQQLRRYGKRRIFLTPALRDRTVSGTFPLTDPDGALVAVAASVDAHVTFIGPWLALVH
ncbi:iron dicitrate transporter FecR [Gluconacetobacter liquefaciens]|uniref:FecR family protein n=2 Tax=Gluconacetobacter liquefaciens TaxID=89584 RepID=A0A370FYP2_GLULI|nr:FecR family protein [Gluconacetobacter liquefaciens]GEB38437.1 iron dicitrate transporter FecR [Gluconacetobacter liquefaciens]